MHEPNDMALYPHPTHLAPHTPPLTPRSCSAVDGNSLWEYDGWGPDYNGGIYHEVRGGLGGRGAAGRQAGRARDITHIRHGCVLAISYRRTCHSPHHPCRPPITITHCPTATDPANRKNTGRPRHHVGPRLCLLEARGAAA